MKNKIFISGKELFCKVLISLESTLGVKTPMVSILGYHSISHDGTLIDVLPKDFSKQIKYMKKKFDFITLDTVVDYIDGKVSITKPSIALTFDDGYFDILKNVIPVLTKNKIPATLFVVSDPEKINRSELENNKRILTLREIKNLQKKGWTIGCHTATHANLVEINDIDLQREIVYSKKSLENYLKTPIHYFAYPKGFYNKNVEQVVKKNKYKAAFTMDERILTKRMNLYSIPRLGVDHTRTEIQFKALFTYSVIAYFMTKKILFEYLYILKKEAIILSSFFMFIFKQKMYKQSLSFK